MQKKKHWKKYKKRKIKFLAKIFLKEKSSGFKSFLGSSLPKDTWLYQEETLIKTSCSLRDIWKQVIFTCIRIMEEQHQLSLKIIGKISLFLWTLWKNLPYLLCVVQKHGRQKLSPEHGGYIRSKFLNQHQLGSSFPLVPLWSEEKETLFILTECRWGWPYCIRLIINLLRDILTIVESMRSKLKRNKSKIKKF